jgi:hypothetical protein
MYLEVSAALLELCCEVGSLRQLIVPEKILFYYLIPLLHLEFIPLSVELED